MQIQDFFSDVNGYYSLMNNQFIQNMTSDDYTEYMITDAFAYRLDLMANHFYNNKSYYLFILWANVIDPFFDVVLNGFSDNYSYANGIFTKSPIPLVTAQALDPISNYADVVQIPNAVPLWTAETQYLKNEYVRYNGTIYKASVNHTSSTDFLSDLAFGNWLTSTSSDYSGKFKFVSIGGNILKLDRKTFWFGVDNPGQQFAIDLSYSNYFGATSNIVPDFFLMTDSDLSLKPGQTIIIPSITYINTYIDTLKKENI